MDTAVSILLAALLVALSGLFSGLNLGLMSFTEDDLGIVIDGSEDVQEKKNAQAIRPVRSRGNLLLCTLLLGNTLVNAVIAILLSDLTSGLIGTVVTTALSELYLAACGLPRRPPALRLLPRSVSPVAHTRLVEPSCTDQRYQTHLGSKPRRESPPPSRA